MSLSFVFIPYIYFLYTFIVCHFFLQSFWRVTIQEGILLNKEKCTTKGEQKISFE